MTTEEFFQSFVAALGAIGEKRITTVGDAHHYAFADAVAELQRAQGAGDAGASKVPSRFQASPFTGRYSQFDEALATFQRVGLLRGVNPFYRYVDIALDAEHAEEVLEAFDPDERTVVIRMARAFAKKEHAFEVDEADPAVA